MKIDGVLAIYDELRKADHTLSLRRFANEYLGRCESYVFSTRYYGRDISDKAVVLLAKNLRDLSSSWSAIHAEDPTRLRCREHSQRYSVLASRATQLLLE